MSAELEVVDQRLAVVENAIGEIKQAVKSIAESMQTLAVLETRHQETRNGLERAFAAIVASEKEQKALLERVHAIEVALPGLKEVRRWVISGVLGTMGFVGVAVLVLVIRA